LHAIQQAGNVSGNRGIPVGSVASSITSAGSQSGNRFKHAFGIGMAAECDAARRERRMHVFLSAVFSNRRSLGALHGANVVTDRKALFLVKPI
jgi:hypothetical protein